jgi:hypothetical protein
MITDEPPTEVPSTTTCRREEVPAGISNAVMSSAARLEGREAYARKALLLLHEADGGHDVVLLADAEAETTLGAITAEHHHGVRNGTPRRAYKRVSIMQRLLLSRYLTPCSEKSKRRTS